jgi:hypothetical protein
MTSEEFSRLKEGGFFKPRPQFRYEPKLTLTKRITGTWGEDVRFFTDWPKKFRPE